MSIGPETSGFDKIIIPDPMSSIPPDSYHTIQNFYRILRRIERQEKARIRLQKLENWRLDLWKQ
jgi:hypothetical protein